MPYRTVIVHARCVCSNVSHFVVVAVSDNSLVILMSTTSVYLSMWYPFTTLLFVLMCLSLSTFVILHRTNITELRIWIFVSLSYPRPSSVAFACAVILLLLTPGCFSLGSTVWVESSQQNSEGVREEISPATLEFLSQRLREFLLKSQPLFS